MKKILFLSALFSIMTPLFAQDVPAPVPAAPAPAAAATSTPAPASSGDEVKAEQFGETQSTIELEKGNILAHSSDKQVIEAFTKAKDEVKKSEVAVTELQKTYNDRTQKIEGLVGQIEQTHNTLINDKGVLDEALKSKGKDS